METGGVEINSENNVDNGSSFAFFFFMPILRLKPNLPDVKLCRRGRTRTAGLAGLACNIHVELRRLILNSKKYSWMSFRPIGIQLSLTIRSYPLQPALRNRGTMYLTNIDRNKTPLWIINGKLRLM